MRKPRPQEGSETGTMSLGFILRSLEFQGERAQYRKEKRPPIEVETWFA